MKTSLIGVDPIPVEFVLNVAQSKGTTALGARSRIVLTR